MDLAPLPITFMSWLNFIAPDKESNLHSQTYRAVLKDKVRFELRKEGKENPSLQEEIEKLKEMYDGKVEEILWASYLVDALDADRFQEISDSWEAYKVVYGESESWKTIQAYKAKKAKLAQGAQAPDFQLKSATGNWLQLDDFEGKLLYIDFWASWCKPCLEEAEASQEIREHFAEEEDFEMIFISLDESEDRWENSRDKMNPKAIHLFAGGWESSIRSAYQIRGIPRYLLISPKGEIISADAPRPSNYQLLVKQIEAALE